MVICRCPAYPFPHRMNSGACGEVSQSANWVEPKRKHRMRIVKTLPHAYQFRGVDDWDEHTRWINGD